MCLSFVQSFCAKVRSIGPQAVLISAKCSSTEIVERAMVSCHCGDCKLFCYARFLPALIISCNVG